MKNEVLKGLIKKPAYFEGEHVYYIPPHRQNEDHRELDPKNMGVVSSSNSEYVFVKYAGSERGHATKRWDLYSFEGLPDFVEKFDNEHLKTKT